jgi:hypothetical protein
LFYGSSTVTKRLSNNIVRVFRARAVPFSGVSASKRKCQWLRIFSLVNAPLQRSSNKTTVTSLHWIAVIVFWTASVSAKAAQIRCHEMLALTLINGCLETVQSFPQTFAIKTIHFELDASDIVLAIQLFRQKLP